MIKKILTVCMALAALSAAGQDNKFSLAQKLGYAEMIIENLYVEEVAADSIVEEGIRAMLKTLDPHSAYSTPDETRELNEPLEGKFSGIGIQFNMSTDTVYVIQTISGGPSEKVGIRPGDRIIAANDTIIAGKKLPNRQVVKTLRGPKGSKVKLKVLRSGVSEPIDFIVTRDDIPINSVEDIYMVTPEIGYIRLSRFAEDSGNEVAEAIKTLKGKGMKSLILDLQDNGGGFLNAAHDIASIFLAEGDTTVYTMGRDKQPNYFRVSTKKPLFDGPVAVLINQYSASASEIVSGALQDNDRGVIVGRRSFGKGLVQRPIPLPDGSMIRLTTARYYTPAGRCIQKHYDKGKSEEYHLDVLNRYKSGELFSIDSIKFDESQKYKTLKKGRTVYGGGGIMPDVFVPLDTTLYTAYYRNVMAKSVIPTYVLTVMDKSRDEMHKKYPTENDFYDKFVVTDELVQGVVDKAAQEGVEYNEEEFNISRPLFEAILKGLLARDLYEKGNYMRAVNPLNPVFVEAVKTLSK